MKEKEAHTDKNKRYFSLIVENKYVSLENIAIPARKEGILRVEPTYRKGEAQGDNENDELVGVVEFRIFYAVNCNGLMS